MEEEEDAPAAGDRTGILRFAMFQYADPVALRCADHRQRMFSALLYPHGASCPWAPTPSRPHVSDVFEIIRELAGMPLRLRQDLQQEPPRRRIALPELAHESGVRRHLLPLEHEVLNNHLAQRGALLGAYPHRRGLRRNLDRAIDGAPPNC